MRCVCLLFALLSTLRGAEPKTLFYLTANPASVKSFLAHIDKIDIVGPQTYYADERGLVWGAVDPAVREAAAKHGVEVMPLVINPGFNQTTIHTLLTTPAARSRMIQFLLDECRRYKYSGFQFDFENVRFDDAGLLADLTEETARAFHAAGLQLSVAAVPRPSEYPGKGDYSQWMYTNWRGAFDLVRLAKAADFISLMTYDEHTRHTPPGPIAGMVWMQTILNYALTKMPADKLSIGIPLYGRRWVAGMRDKDTPAISVAPINGAAAVDLAGEFKVSPQWDDTDKTPWYFFYRDYLREYVFWTDARAFRERWQLVDRHNLHGISCWVLGDEDPSIWAEVPTRKRGILR